MRVTRAITVAPLVAAALLAAACAGAPAASGAQQPEALYREKCSGCHRPYDPASRSRAQWKAAMDRMAPRAHLAPEQTASLRHWLEARASDAEAAR
jgi:hypothetical protein